MCFILICLIVSGIVLIDLLMKKDLFIIALKVLLYALSLLAAYFGVSALSSCSASHSVQGTGKTTVILVDTTYLYHDGFLKTK